MADSTVGFHSFAGYAPEDDVCLIDGLRAGSDEAYEELIARFEQPVYSLVYRLMEDPADASDVV